MSMEKRLKREYELATNLGSCPSPLDERIGAMYHIHIQAGQQFILRVASDSQHATKEQLLQVATGLK